MSLQSETYDAITSRRHEIADFMTDQQFERMPGLAERYGAIGRVRCHEDALYHLSYLADAVAMNSPSLFADYIAWARVLLAQVKVPAEDLVLNLQILREGLFETLDMGQAEAAAPYIDAALEKLPSFASELPSLIVDDDTSELANAYLSALLKYQRQEAADLIIKAVEGGLRIEDLYMNVFQRAQHEIGRLWQMSKISVAQEHYCTASTQMIMSQLYPYIFSEGKTTGRTFVGASMGGELHEIGARMVADFFEMAGWNTIYLGANVPIRGLISTLRDAQPDVLGISATMTFHLKPMRDYIEAIRKNEEFNRIKIIVGGYPFRVDPNLWKQIGADGYATDARGAVETANRLL